MIDHDYHITVREITSEKSQHTFVAKLSSIYIIMAGKRIKSPYPISEFTALTQIDAMLKANRAAQKRLATLTSITL